MDFPGSQTSAALDALATGKVGTLASIQYTCLSNPHLAIRPTRKGPDGSKPVMTWIGLSGNQPAIHWMGCLTKLSRLYQTTSSTEKLPTPSAKGLHVRKIEIVQQKEAQGLALHHRVTKVHDCPSGPWILQEAQHCSGFSSGSDKTSGHMSWVYLSCL